MTTHEEEILHESHCDEDKTSSEGNSFILWYEGVSLWSEAKMELQWS